MINHVQAVTGLSKDCPGGGESGILWFFYFFLSMTLNHRPLLQGLAVDKLLFLKWTNFSPSINILPKSVQIGAFVEQKLKVQMQVLNFRLSATLMGQSSKEDFSDLTA